MSVPMPISRATLCNAISIPPRLPHFLRGSQQDGRRRQPQFVLASKPKEVKRLLAARSVDAPRAGPCRGEIEKSEAIERGELATVEDREEATWGVGVEIGDRRHAREDEGDWACEQSDHQQ